MRHVVISSLAAVLVAACVNGPSGGTTASKPTGTGPTGQVQTEPQAEIEIAAKPQPPKAAPMGIPRMRWDGKPGAKAWTRSSLNAMKGHGAPLTRMVPADIDGWCPAYRTAGPDQRGAFWVGMMSALAKHESTYRPGAVGGGGKWYGLLQILPATARGYGCKARSGAALKDGSANLSCAIRIMAKTVPRDGVIATKSGRWRGVAADWGPMRVSSKRNDMKAWVRKQSYCRLQSKA